MDRGNGDVITDADGLSWVAIDRKELVGLSQELLDILTQHKIPFTRRDYGHFITINTASKAYEFRVGGAIIGIYSF